MLRLYPCIYKYQLHFKMYFYKSIKNLSSNNQYLYARNSNLANLYNLQNLIHIIHFKQQSRNSYQIFIYHSILTLHSSLKFIFLKNLHIQLFLKLLSLSFLFQIEELTEFVSDLLNFMEQFNLNFDCSKNLNLSKQIDFRMKYSNLEIVNLMKYLKMNLGD